MRILTRSFLLLSMWLISTHASASCAVDEDCIRLSGVGHGLVAEDASIPLAQRQLQAIRAAKLDALRSLAEQARGVRIESISSADAARLNMDRTLVRVDTRLRGVRYVKVEPLQPDIYQAVAELEIAR